MDVVPTDRVRNKGLSMFLTSLLLNGILKCCALDQHQNILCPTTCSCLGNLVDCSRRSLTTLPSSLPHWTQSLDLRENQLEAVNVTELTQHAEQLQTLKLGNNRLRHLWSSEAGTQTSHIKHLYLNNNNLVDIRQMALAAMTSLRVVDLSNNELRRLDKNSLSAINSSSQLEQLLIDNNELSVIEVNSLNSLTQLELLKLNHNKLRQLDKHLFTQLHKLKYLELERNRLETIDGLVFTGLRSVVSLKLKRNQISQLMDGAFWGLTAINSLDLSYNNISTVNKRWLYGLDSLRQLCLSHNHINKVEAGSWSFSAHLTELDLRHNSLSVISERMFQGLDSLRQLQLTANRILLIADEGFIGLSALHSLDLSENNISWSLEEDSSVFDALSSLRRLSLSHNKLRCMSKRVFSSVARLRQLYIEFNDLSSIQQGSLDSLMQLQQLRLNTTSLVCDCRLSWFIEFIRNHSQLVSTLEARCAFPESFAGLNVADVNVADLKCLDFVKPTVTRNPVSHRALRYGNVTLTCEVVSNRGLTVAVRWRKDNDILADNVIENTVVPSSERFAVHILSQLHIWPVVDSHAGRYQCIATNDLGTSCSTKALLTVNVFPTFIKTPVDVSVRSGTTARLDCAAHGVPSPEIALQKDGGDDFPAARERRMHIYPSDEMFFIVDVKLEDQGLYTCTARNDVGVISTNATLQVLEAPSFARQMVNKVSLVGETTVLECMSAGSPKPRLTWLKDQLELSPTLRHFFTADNQLLVIVQTELSDAGVYMCVLTNSLGSSRQVSELVVLTSTDNSNNNLLVTTTTTADDMTTTTGIVVIAVVACVVVTSLIWVIVIYRSRRGYRHHGNKTNISASSEGSTHRLLLTCADNSLTNLKYRDMLFDAASHSSSGSNFCHLHQTSALLSHENTVTNKCQHHSCYMLSTGPNAAIGQAWTDSGTDTVDSSLADDLSLCHQPMFHTFHNIPQQQADKLQVAARDIQMTKHVVSSTSNDMLQQNTVALSSQASTVTLDVSNTKLCGSDRVDSRRTGIKADRGLSTSLTNMSDCVSLASNDSRTEHNSRLSVSFRDCVIASTWQHSAVSHQKEAAELLLSSYYVRQT